MEFKIKALIVDDEAHARENLSLIISDFCPSIELLGVAATIEEGEEMISTLKPQLVFMDIQMGSRTIFELLNRLNSIQFEIIFVTAYDNYAVKAFRYMAIDYILKPINTKLLIEAVARTHENIRKRNFIDHFHQYMQEPFTPSPQSPQKISLPTSNGYVFVEIDEISHCVADRSYTKIHLADGTDMLVSKHLKHYEDLLADRNFFRVHNSSLVNLNHVKSLNKNDGGYLIMQNGEKITLSRGRKGVIIERLNQIS